MHRSPATSATVPARIGRFEVRALLGSGGFGSVYRAHDPLLGRAVALEVAHAGLVENPTQRKRFLREGRTSAKFRHPTSSLSSLPARAGGDSIHWTCWRRPVTMAE